MKMEKRAKVYYKFINGLKGLNLDPNLVINTYIVCGTDGKSRACCYKFLSNQGIQYFECETDGKNRCKCSKNLNDKGMQYFKMCFGILDFPAYKETCVCGVHIKENCYITTQDLNYNNIIVVGTCCYENFILIKNSKCLLCNENHKNGIRKNKGFCDDCAVVRTEIIQQQTTIKRQQTLSRKKILNEENRVFKTLFNNTISELVIFEYIKMEQELLNSYKVHIQHQLEELNNKYKPVYNGFKLLNKFAKICTKSNKKIYFKYCTDYNIACLYENYKHVYTMNLDNMRPTKKSPSQEIINI